MSIRIRFLAAVVAMAIIVGAVGFYAYRHGWHRQLVHYLYARMLEGELVAADTVILHAENSPYEKWLAENRAKLPMLETMVIDDISEIELKGWPEMGLGVSGLYLRFADYQLTDGRLLEIPVGGNTVPQRHFYEIGTYVLAGTGHTIISAPGHEDERVDWQAGSLISIPLMDSYQHFNGGDLPVRLLSVSSFPFVINSFDSEQFASDSAFSFERRPAPSGEFAEFYRDTGELVKQRNMVGDVVSVETAPNRTRGLTNRGAYWQLVGNSALQMHISEFAPYSYKKAHRHSSEAFILIVSGSGFSLIWPETLVDSYRRIDWRPGTLFVPPSYWYHQHFNPGSEPARYLVINTGALVRNLGLRFYNQLEVDSNRVKNIWQLELQKSPPLGR